MAAGTPVISLLEPRVARESAGSPGFANPNRKFTDGEKLTIQVKTTGSKLNVAGELGYRKNIPEEESCDPIAWQLKLCHRQLGFKLAMLLGPAVVTVGDSGATNPYDTGSFAHTWVVAPNVAYAPQLYSIMAGVRYGGAYEDIIQQVQGAAFHTLKLNTKRGESAGNVSGSIEGFSRTLQPTDPANQFPAADNATMTLDTTGITAGTFGWVNPKNGNKATWAFDAVASAIQTALRGTGIYGAGNVTVSTVTAPVSSTTGGKFTVTFVGSLANTRIALPILDLTAATGTATAIYTNDSDNHLLRGEVGEWDYLPMLPNRFDVFCGTDMSDPFASGNQLPDEFTTNVDFSKFFDKKFVQDSSQTSYKSIKFLGVADGRKQGVEIVTQYDATGIAFLDAWRNITELNFGLRCVSPVMVAGSTPFGFYLSGKMGIDSYNQGEENEKVVAVKVMGDFLVNADQAGEMFKVVVVSDVPNYYRS